MAGPPREVAPHPVELGGFGSLGVQGGFLERGQLGGGMLDRVAATWSSEAVK